MNANAAAKKTTFEAMCAQYDAHKKARCLGAPGSPTWGAALRADYDMVNAMLAAGGWSRNEFFTEYGKRHHDI